MLIFMSKLRAPEQDGYSVSECSRYSSTPARPTIIHAECDAINSMEGVAVGATLAKRPYVSIMAISCGRLIHCYPRLCCQITPLSLCGDK